MRLHLLIVYGWLAERENYKENVWAISLSQNKYFDALYDQS